MTITFKTSREDHDLIEKIADRAVTFLRAQGHHRKRFDMVMDITACHANGNPLRLAELLAADDFNFAHDVVGIVNCLDRSTGKLMNCFSPRFSAPLDEVQS